MALRKESTMEGCLNTLSEGGTLIQQLGCVSDLENAEPVLVH